MNETLHLLKTRRSVPPHLLLGPSPDGAEIEALLATASRVPDHGRLVPWRFLVIAGEARARVGEAIGTAFAADEPDCGPDRLDAERNRMSRAPLVIGVVSRARPHVKIPEREQVLSAGAVCMNLVLAAHAMGYAASWLTEWFAYDRRVLDGLGLDPGETVAGFIHIGRPAEAIADRPRPALADVVTYL